MPEALLDIVLGGVTARLATMVGVRFFGERYPHDVRVSTRAWPEETAPEPFMLTVVEGLNSRLEPDTTGRPGFAEYKHTYNLLVSGYVAGDDVVAPMTWRARLRADVQRTLLKDWTLGGALDDTGSEILGMDFPDDDSVTPGEVDPRASFYQLVTLTVTESIAVA